MKELNYTSVIFIAEDVGPMLIAKILIETILFSFELYGISIMVLITFDRTLFVVVIYEKYIFTLRKFEL